MRIETRDLSKVYPGGRTALSGVSLSFDRGLTGLLGPNGAGKSTFMKVLCTLLEPTSGAVLVDGHDLATDRNLVRSRLGYLGQEWGAPANARCAEVVDLALGLRGWKDKTRRRAEVQRTLGLVGLEGHAHRKVKTLSGGMVRRLGVAQALAGSPDLIVMDEPTVGLDPDERVEFRSVLAQLGRDRTILLSTHVVADVGNTCESVAVLEQGRLAFTGPPADFAARARGRVFELVARREDEDRVRQSFTVVSAVPTPAGPRLRLVGDPVAGLDLQPVEPTLEDAYLLVVGADEAGEAVA